MKFVDIVNEQEARTLNHMKARKTTANACVDFFFKVGASRGQDILPSFISALGENLDLAIRIMLWSRDARGGAGERQLFRDMLSFLEKTNPDLAMAVIRKIPELGRWDDMLIDYVSPKVRDFAYSMYHYAIFEEKNGLAAKWCPRKGTKAVELRKAWKLSPKRYRKTLVELTKVVEQKMCANEWEEINFSQVPSLASARYKRAFYRHVPEKFESFLEKVKKGEAKINAGAVFPYDVLKNVNTFSVSPAEITHMNEQWKALPNYVGDASILPVVDTSGSMYHLVGKNLTALHIAVSLGLYLADKNKGKFKDIFMNFSSTPQLIKLKGTDIYNKYHQLEKADWGMSTNLHAVFDLILKTAQRLKVPQCEMPEMILIFSDMQFNYCVDYDDSAIQMIERKYKQFGYNLPKVVFWNIVAYNNVPVKFDKNGVALVSGFSPSLVKSLLKGNLEQFTPYNIMLDTVMVPRYDI